MASILSKGFKFFIANPLAKIDLVTNQFNKQKQCYICKKRFDHFSKHRGGSKNIALFFKRLELIGSDVDNFRCLYCEAHDRERHLFMYFDKLNFWEKFKNGNVLHFAIEKNLTQAIEKLQPLMYVKADLFPKSSSITKMDCTAVPHPDNTFDVIICNHVLEHVPDYKKAMSEFYRVLKPGGSAILQVPLARLLKRNFEVKNTDTDELCNYFYEQKDHVRLFSEDQYLEDLANCGFKLAIAKSNTYFTQEECKLYGVNFKEDLICVEK